MFETYFMVDGDGPSFEPVSFRFICHVKISIPGSDRVSSALIKTDQEIPSSAFRESGGYRYSHFVITGGPNDLNLPLKDLPMSAGLNPYRGAIDDLIHSGSIPMADVGPVKRVLIFGTEKEARCLYDQNWG